MPGSSTELETVSEALQQLCVEVRKQPIENSPSSKPKVVVISGPTACGKSAFAMLLAKCIGGEIISADSMQVYRQMDVGTAKPSVDEQLEIPHHLVDIQDLTSPYTVVDFFEAATTACQTVLQRGNIPIVVGGSGFYIHTLIYGPPQGPPPDPIVRKRLQEEMVQKGPKILFDRLKRLDPEYAETITEGDKHKIVRALEIIAVTGQKVSAIQWHERCQTNEFDFRCWFLYRPKQSLYQRIETRCDQMITAGLVEETQSLLKAGLKENPAASQSIGYRQCIDFLNSEQTEQDYQNFVTKFKQASRNYAKRQFTWFRREPLFKWLDVDTHDFENVMEIVTNDLSQLP